MEMKPLVWLVLVGLVVMVAVAVIAWTSKEKPKKTNALYIR
jgi:hypothetical protein